uniref:Bm718 n=1 Tax=Brugia malayi TaxID=6279 RepID=A0A1I9G581_BRUMA|nr:Bm718 [Brugia malayi]
MLFLIRTRFFKILANDSFRLFIVHEIYSIHILL